MAEYTGIHDFSGATLNGVAAASIFETTVGATGATYTTLKAAVDAGSRRILVVDNTTEIADIAVPSGGLYLHILEGVTVNLDNYAFTYAATANVKVRGEGTLAWAHTAGVTLFLNDSYGATATVDVEGVTLDNNSTSDNTYLSSGVERIHNVILNAANASQAGIYGDQPSSSYVGITVTGAGSSCQNAFVYVGSVNPTAITNLRFTGTFESAGPMATILNASVGGLAFDVSSLSTIRIQTGTQLHDMYCDALYVDIECDASDMSLSNLYLNGGTIIIDTGRSLIRCTNVNSDTGLINQSHPSANNCEFSNSRFGGKSLLAGNNNRLSNCNLAGIDLPATASENLLSNCGIAGSGIPILGDSNQIANCIIDGDVLVGANSNTLNGCTINGTLLVSAAASGTMIVGCRYDAISDAGTDTDISSSREF